MSAGGDETARLKLVENERRKLSATYLNGIAIAVFAVGGFAPFVTTLLAAGSNVQNPFWVGVLMGVCWIVSGVLHSAARASLKGLQP